MTKVFFCRRPSVKCERSRKPDNKLRRALSNYQWRRSQNEMPKTRVMNLDSEDPVLDELNVVRYLGVVDRGRGLNRRTEVKVEVRNDAAPDSVGDMLLDAIPSREPMRAGVFDHRCTNWSNGPLRRLLRSKVGRPWLEVECELKRELAGGSDLNRLARESLDNLVLRQVEWVNGKLHDTRQPVREWGRLPNKERFFVHPDSGTLEVWPRKPKEKKGGPRYEQVIVSKLERLVKIDGTWYRVDLQPIPTIDSLVEQYLKELPECLREEYFERGVCPTGPVDVILKQEAVDDPARNYRDYGRVSNFGLTPFLREWGTKIYAVHMEQASYDDLRKHGVYGKKTEKRDRKSGSQKVIRQRHRLPPACMPEVS